MNGNLIDKLKLFAESCRVASDLMNGKIKFAYSPFQAVFLGDAINSGSSIAYHCDNDFELIGRDSNFCAEGKWEHDPPRCAPICSLGIMDNIIQLDYNCYANGKEIPCADYAKAGTILKTKCRGLIDNGPTENIKMSTCESGQWLPMPTSCESPCGKGDTPWEAFIFDGSNTRRGRGKIITPKIVLTSAYCFWNKDLNKMENISDYRIVVGEGHESNETAIANTYLIDKVKFDKHTYRLGNLNDTTKLALVGLDQPILFNGKDVPICLYPDKEYEKIQKFGRNHVAPDIEIHTDVNHDLINDVETSYDIYTDWALPKIRSYEKTGKFGRA